jgi:DNA (cytosine-5)-methyltransferase 1
LKAISLFSGAGGMDLGAANVGIETIFANDTMPEAAETHRLNLPGADFVLGDVKGVVKVPQADLVTGGYPCQSFSMGGNRKPQHDDRTQLYEEFGRIVDLVSPRFFVAENVSGLKSLQDGHWLEKQLDLFQGLGRNGGYNISWQVLQAQDYGVPQRRKRLFIVGVRRDLGLFYWFPHPTHAKPADAARHGLLPYASHGDAILGLPLWPTGEFYERPHDPEGHWSWYFMSRNRKAPWDGPSFTVVANFRHVTLHPASSTMRLVWSNLADGFKQKWEFTGEYEHTAGHPDRPVLAEPRRLSWRECALIQTFPKDFEPAGKLERKFELIGNAVPPMLGEAVLRPLVDGTGLRSVAPPKALFAGRRAEPAQMSLAL